MNMPLFKTLSEIEHQIALNDLQLKLNECEKKYNTLKKSYEDTLSACNKLLDEGEIN